MEDAGVENLAQVKLRELQAFANGARLPKSAYSSRKKMIEGAARSIRLPQVVPIQTTDQSIASFQRQQQFDENVNVNS